MCHKNNCSCHYHASNGFTLIEILIALMIFAIISVITAEILHTELIARKSLQESSEQLNEILFATTLLQQDISQIVNRAIIDSNGNWQPALQGLENSITFTRTGVVNPNNIFAKSSLQRVSYYIKNNNLMRASWQNLDQTPGELPEEKIILTDIKSFNLNYLGNSSGFTQTFLNQNNSLLFNLPRAIKINIVLMNNAQVNLLIPLGNNFTV